MALAIGRHSANRGCGEFLRLIPASAATHASLDLPSLDANRKRLDKERRSANDARPDGARAMRAARKFRWLVRFAPTSGVYAPVLTRLRRNSVRALRLPNAPQAPRPLVRGRSAHFQDSCAPQRNLDSTRSPDDRTASHSRIAPIREKH